MSDLNTPVKVAKDEDEELLAWLNESSSTNKSSSSNKKKKNHKKKSAGGSRKKRDAALDEKELLRKRWRAGLEQLRQLLVELVGLKEREDEEAGDGNDPVVVMIIPEKFQLKLGNIDRKREENVDFDQRQPELCSDTPVVVQIEECLFNIKSKTLSTLEGIYASSKDLPNDTELLIQSSHEQQQGKQTDAKEEPVVHGLSEFDHFPTIASICRALTHQTRPDVLKTYQIILANL